MSIAVIILILAMIACVCTGACVWFLKRSKRMKNEAAELSPHIEHEMSVSEFNSLIEDRESAARAPLENKITELESRLSEQDEEGQGSKESREPLP